jgi:hypothetical protein
VRFDVLAVTHLEKPGPLLSTLIALSQLEPSTQLHSIRRPSQAVVWPVEPYITSLGWLVVPPASPFPLGKPPLASRCPVADPALLLPTSQLTRPAKPVANISEQPHHLILSER